MICPSLNVYQTGSKHARHFNAPPYDERSAEWSEEQEGLAKHKAYQLHNVLFKINGHYRDVHKTNIFRSYVLTKATNTTTSLVTDSNETVYMGDSGVSLHMMGLSSLKKLSEQHHSRIMQNS